MPKEPAFQIIGSKGWRVMETKRDHLVLIHEESKPILLERDPDAPGTWKLSHIEFLNMAPNSQDYVGKEFRREMMGLGEPS